jgi:integrase
VGSINMPNLPENKKTNMIKLAAIDGKQTDYKDSGRDRVSGLVLRVSPTGSKSWALTARRPGHKNPSRFTLGDYRYLTLTEARNKAHKFKADLRDGIDPIADKRKRRAEAAETKEEPDTVRSISVRFLKHCKKKNRTAGEQERIIAHDVLPVWGDRSLSDIKKRDVLDLLERKADTSPVMANRLLALIRRFFNWAVTVDLLDKNPAADLEAPHKEKSRDRVLNDNELVLFWSSTEAIGRPYAPAYRFLCLTGQRLSEVGGMSWSEVDIEKAEWVIPADGAKNGKAHAVDLSPLALEIIENQPQIGPLVFASTGEKPLNGFSRAKSRLDAAMKKQRLEVGLPESVPSWRNHDLRRTAATGMAALGFPPHVVEKTLNHVSGVTGGLVKVYQHHDNREERKAALLAWGRKVDSLVNGNIEDNVVPLVTA